MTRAELKLTNSKQYLESEYIVCMTSLFLLPFTRKRHVTRSLSLYNHLTTLFSEKSAIHVNVMDRKY
jgi:hypothetical protein